MKIIGAVALLGMVASGCATAFLPPIEIKCRGKGTITGVAGPYGFTATGDCGEGFEYTRTHPK